MLSVESVVKRDLVAVYTLLHARGCGKPAYRIEELAIAGVTRHQARVVHLDGTYPKPNDVQVCDSCGRKLGPRDIKFAYLRNDDRVRTKH